MLNLSNRTDRHGRTYLPWRTLLLSGLALTLYLLLGPAPEPLVYHRTAIGNGEWWRLITGHWVHSDAEHLAWDLIAFCLLSLLIERESPKLFTGILLGATLSINLCLWYALPWLEAYCGLSGILNALLGGLLLTLWRQRGDRVFLYIGGAAILKILFEIGSNQALFTHTAWPSVPEAHAAGMLTGIVIALLTGLGRQNQTGHLVKMPG